MRSSLEDSYVARYFRETFENMSIESVLASDPFEIIKQMKSKNPNVAVTIDDYSCFVRNLSAIYLKNKEKSCNEVIFENRRMGIPLDCYFPSGIDGFDNLFSTRGIPGNRVVQLVGDSCFYILNNMVSECINLTEFYRVIWIQTRPSQRWKYLKERIINRLKSDIESQSTEKESALIINRKILDKFRELSKQLLIYQVCDVFQFLSLLEKVSLEISSHPELRFLIIFDDIFSIFSPHPLERVGGAKGEESLGYVAYLDSLRLIGALVQINTLVILADNLFEGQFISPGKKGKKCEFLEELWRELIEIVIRISNSMPSIAQIRKCHISLFRCIKNN